MLLKKSNIIHGNILCHLNDIMLFSDKTYKNITESYVFLDLYISNLIWI